MAHELGSDLTGVYLFGSAALGDYRPHRSDLDVAVVAGCPLTAPVKARVVEVLDHRVLPCPARKLELVVYERGRLSRGDVSCELDLNTGAGGREWRTSSAEAHWYVLDVAIGRERGVALSGPPPPSVFPDQPRERILAAVRASLDWHSDHAEDPVVDPGDVVLNACRAWRWLEEGEWCPKGAAGRWAVARGAGEVVTTALAHHAGEKSPPAPSDARIFARAVRERAAAATPP